MGWSFSLVGGPFETSLQKNEQPFQGGDAALYSVWIRSGVDQEQFSCAPSACHGNPLDDTLRGTSQFKNHTSFTYFNVHFTGFTLLYLVTGFTKVETQFLTVSDSSRISH